MTDIVSILGHRKKDTHKGDYGRLLIYAGSPGMAGAAILCVKGAFRTGTGLVYAALDKEMFPIMQTAVPEAICLDRSARRNWSDYDAIVFGPGMGRGAEAAALLKDILGTCCTRMLIDADGLNLISAYNLYDEVRNSRAEIVVTPHEGEAARLLGEEIPGREKRALELSSRLSATAVLKGSNTIVTDGENIYINNTGNPGMAAAGSGDVLSGVIGSLLAQGRDAFEAAVCGVYLHGLAGDLAAAEKGQWAVMAGDIAEKMGLAIKDIIGE